VADVYALQALAASEVCRGGSPHRLMSGIASASWRASVPWSTGSSRGPPICCARRDRCRRGWHFGSPRKSGEATRAAAGRGKWPEPDWETGRARDSNASCWRAMRKGTGSACWCAWRRARVIRRIPMRAWRSCIWLDGELVDRRSASFSRATTTAVRPGTSDERVWSETGLHLPSHDQHQRRSALTMANRFHSKARGVT